ncbi:hypothetical protein ACHWQZ_G007027 [Mnemiopsis leidyi]
MCTSPANKYISQLAQGTFSKDLVDHVVLARDRLKQLIRQELQLTNKETLRADTLIRSHVTREQTCEWLEAVSCILDSFCVPLLQNGASLVSVVEQLKEEKVSDQNTIIELQGRLLGKKEEELRVLEQGCSADVPTSSSVLMPNRNEDLESRAQLQNLWDYRHLYQAVAGRQKTGENVGVSRDSALESLDGLREIMAHIGDFTLHSSDHVTQVLKRAKSLREEDDSEL